MSRRLLTGKGFKHGGTIPFPLTLSNLIGWYKADVGITGTSSITAIADQSGNGNNLSVHNINSGVIALNSTGYTGSLGSKPAIMFDNSGSGSSTNAAFASGTSTGTITLPATNVWTAWAIGQDTTLSATFGALLSFGVGAGSDGTSTSLPRFIGNDSTTSILSGIGNVFAIGTVSKGVNHTFISTNDGTTVTFYVDGTSIATGTVTPAMATPTNLILGSDWNGALGFNCWDGAICEVGVAVSYSASNVSNLHSYLVGKWGL